MAWRLSEGFQDAVLDTASYKGALANGFIEIYDGARPSSVEDSPTGTKLAVLTNGGLPVTPGDPTNGLNMELVAHLLGIAAGETWKGVGIADGTAGWARFYENAANPTVWKDGTITTTPGSDLALEGGRTIITGQDVTITSVVVAASGV